MEITPATRRLRKAALPLERRLVQYLCPIVGTDKDHGQIIGSGFILKLSSAAILITAGHVLRECENCCLRIPSGKVMIPIEGRPYVNRQPDKPAAFDPDIGFVVLDAQAMIGAPDAECVTVADLDVDDIPTVQTAYGCWGTPGEINRLVGGEFDVRATFYGGLPAPEITYQLVGVQMATHFVMTCDRELMFDESCKVIQSPRFSGVSGGPAFRLGSFADIIAGVAQPKLVGVFVEGWSRWAAMVFIRMSIVVSALRQLLPQFAGELPTPSYVEMQVRADT